MITKKKHYFSKSKKKILIICVCIFVLVLLVCLFVCSFPFLWVEFELRACLIFFPTFISQLIMIGEGHKEKFKSFPKTPKPIRTYYSRHPKLNHHQSC